MSDDCSETTPLLGGDNLETVKIMADKSRTEEGLSLAIKHTYITHTQLLVIIGLEFEPRAVL